MEMKKGHYPPRRAKVLSVKKKKGVVEIRGDDGSGVRGSGRGCLGAA